MHLLLGLLVLQRLSSCLRMIEFVDFFGKSAARFFEWNTASNFLFRNNAIRLFCGGAIFNRRLIYALCIRLIYVIIVRHICCICHCKYTNNLTYTRFLILHYFKERSVYLFLPRPSLGVGSSILLRSLGSVGLLHRSNHTLNKCNLVLVQAVFLVQHLVCPRVSEDFLGYVRFWQQVPKALTFNNPTIVRVRDQREQPLSKRSVG